MQPFLRFAILASAVFTLLQISYAQQYVVTDLGGAPLGCYPMAVNNVGEAAGYCEDASYGTHAMFWSRSGQMEEIGFPLLQAKALAINDSGYVVGYTGGFGPYLQPFIWKQGLSMQSLGSLGGPGDGGATGINELGQVVGYSYAVNNVLVTFLWENGHMKNIGVPGVGVAINRLGDVTGFWDMIDLGFEQAFVWSEAQGIRGLGFLVKGTKPYSGGDALNNVGEVVGCASTEYLGHAFLWSEAEGMRDLGTLQTGGNTSCALGINDAGEVVGSSGNTTVHPFLWTRSAGMQDLNSLIPPNSGWVLGSANAINAAGQIVGEGGLNGHGRAFLLTPQASREK